MKAGWAGPWSDRTPGRGCDPGRGSPNGDSVGRGPGTGLWEGQAAACAAGASERRVHGRGRPNACQGGWARAGRQAEPGWAGREGRAGAGGQAASRSGQRTAGGAWNLTDPALPRPPRHLGPGPTSQAGDAEGACVIQGPPGRPGGDSWEAGKGPGEGTCGEGPGPASTSGGHLQTASCTPRGRPGSPGHASRTPQPERRPGLRRDHGGGGDLRAAPPAPESVMRHHNPRPGSTPGGLSAGCVVATGDMCPDPERRPGPGHTPSQGPPPSLGAAWPEVPSPPPATSHACLRVVSCASRQKPGSACHTPGGG